MRDLVGHSMHHQREAFFLAILLALLPITPLALTVPSLNLIAQDNVTAAPVLSVTAHNTHLNLTNPFLPVCYFIDDPPMSTISATKCAFLAEDVCTGLTSRSPERNKWVWSEISGCAVGYYFPDEVPVPNRYRCEYMIFEPIRRECIAGGRYNAGAINVANLPDFASEGTAVLENQGRFLIAPERLTL